MWVSHQNPPGAENPKIQGDQKDFRQAQKELNSPILCKKNGAGIFWQEPRPKSFFASAGKWREKRAKGAGAERSFRRAGKSASGKKHPSSKMRGCFSSLSFREWFKTRLTSKEFFYTQEEEDKKQEDQGVRGGVGGGGLAGYGSVEQFIIRIEPAARDYVLRPWITVRIFILSLCVRRSKPESKQVRKKEIIQPSPSHPPPPPFSPLPPFSLSSTYV